MPQNRIIKFRRTNTSDVPTGDVLAPGELAYLEGNKSLVIGKTAATTTLVLDGSIIDSKVSGNPTSINLKSRITNPKTLTIDTSDLTSDIKLILPASNPNEETPLLVDNVGNMIYEEPLAGDIVDIGDVGVTDDPLENDEILIYDHSVGKWNHTPALTFKNLMGLGPDADVHYNDVTVNNILEVDDDSAVMDVPIITVMDKMVSLGINSNLSTVAATMSSGQVFLGDITMENTPSQAFVDSEFSHVPTGIYTVYQTAESDSGVVDAYTDANDVVWTTNTFSIDGNDPIDSDKTDTFVIAGQIIADILLVGGGSGSSSGNSEGAHGSTFRYLKDITIPAGIYNVQVGKGGWYGDGDGSDGYGLSHGGNSQFYPTGDNIGNFSNWAAEGGEGTGTANGYNWIAGGDGARSNQFQTGGQAYNNGQHNTVHGGHGWTEGDTLWPSNNDYVAKIKTLVESIETGQGHSEDTHITRADAKEGVRWGFGPAVMGWGAPMQYEMLPNPYHVQNLVNGEQVNTEENKVDDATPVGAQVVVTGVKFEINAEGNSYSGGGSGYASTTGVGNFGIGSLNDSNHGGGGGWSSQSPAARGGSGIVIVRYRKPGSAGGSIDGKAFDVPDSSYTHGSEEDLQTFNISVSDTPSTDTTADGGGILIPAETQKKLHWVMGSGWEFVGGELEIDADGTENTALYVGGHKVLEVDVNKLIVATGAGDGEINLVDAQALHNFDEGTHIVNAYIQVGRIDPAFKVVGVELNGDLDFGSDDDF